MDKREQLVEMFPDEEILLADGFDDAILGYDVNSGKAIYSIKRTIEILCEDMTDEEAWEYFGFNIQCAYVGEKTPVWCDDTIFD